MRRLGLILIGLLVLAPVLAAQGITPSAAVTSAVYDGTTPLLPKYAMVDEAISGDNLIVAAVADKKIRVLGAVLTMTGTSVTLRFESGNGGQALTGPMQPTQGQTITFPFNPVGWFETSTNTLLNLELSGAQSVDGVVVYVEVP